MSPPLSNLAEKGRHEKKEEEEENDGGGREASRDRFQPEREPKLLVPPPIAHPRDLLPVFMNFLDVCLEL